MSTHVRMAPPFIICLSEEDYEKVYGKTGKGDLQLLGRKNPVKRMPEAISVQPIDERKVI